jgi:rubredoxin
MLADKYYSGKELLTVTIVPYMSTSDNPFSFESVRCGLCDERANGTIQELHDAGWKWQHLPYDCARVCPACHAAGKLMDTYDDERGRLVKPRHVIERAS